MRDLLTEAINHPAGRLANALLHRLEKGADGQELAPDLQARLDKLADAPGRFGILARVTLARAIAQLFERAPQWTTAKLVPLFDWQSPEAQDVWEARKYGNIGSPALFEKTKAGFLGLFSRTNLDSDQLRIFADWLTIIMLTNQSRREQFYPISEDEARTAVRRAGDEALPTVGHRLAITLESAKQEDKIECWRTLVEPVFSALWPLDVDLQTQKSTFKLVQILRASGAAFPEAAEVIIPFVRPEDPRSHTSIFSISQAPNELYASAPEKMLDLVLAVIGDGNDPYGLPLVLEKLKSVNPKITEKKKYQRLVSRSRLAN